MSKKNNTVVEKKPLHFDSASIIVLAGAAIVTVLLLGLLIYNVSKPFKYAHYDDLKVVNYENYKTQNDNDEYYVFVLDGQSKKAPMLEGIVVQYANYSRTHSSARDIYLYDYRAEGNSKILTDLSITTSSDKLPGLILIKGGKVSSKYLSYSDASNELAKAMNK